MYKKDTSWATNAPWAEVLVARCPGPPECGPHPTLQGFAYDNEGKRHWAAELAVEYPEGLCDTLVEAYAKGLDAEPNRTLPSPVTYGLEGKSGGIEAETRKQARERENALCLGGLRNPHLTREKYPGWSSVGDGLAATLDRFAREHHQELQN